MKYHIEFDLELRRNPYTGLYIAFEGIDGSGKNTQENLLSEYLVKKKRKVLKVSEPNESLPAGKLIRQVLNLELTVPPESFQFLYTADRIMNQKETVEPELENGTTVLSHRCFWSAVPYGLFDKIKKGEQYDFKKANHLLISQGILSLYHQCIAPDITFFLDVPADTVIDRLTKMSSKELYEKHEKLATIRNGYLWLVQEFPDEFIIVNGDRTPEEISKDIIAGFEKTAKRLRKIL